MMDKQVFKPIILVTVIFLLSSIMSSSTSAGEFVINEFTIHYSVVNSSVIEPKIATQYGIKRSKNRAMLNISLVKNLSDKAQREGEVEGVTANVFGTAITLVGHLKELSFKEIIEEKAVYYIATFPINNAERLAFDLKIQPNKEGKLISVKFKQQVFVD